MAEKRNYPDQSDDGYVQKHEAGDPLAELARLIGQSDPFADAGRPAKGSPLDSLRGDDRPAPQWLARPSAPAPQDSDYDPRPPRAAYQAQSSHQEAPRDERYSEQQPAAEHADYPADAAYPEDNDAYYEQGGDERYQVKRPPPAEYEDGFYAEDGHMPPHGDDHYAPRRRGGLLTIAAVFGLAVVGTAGAFGYRAFTSPSATSDNPPVIKADPTPVKIVPPASGDQKPFQERVDTPGAERVVPREEQPVSLPVTRPNPPPPQSAFAPVPGAAAPSAMVAPTAATPSNINEPKRVRTMTIRQDAGGDPQAAAPAAPAARAPAAAPAAKQSAGPMAIAPQSDTSRTKIAARTPPAQAAGGAYVVQVSAQKTEEEAQSSYRSLQQKYPGVLAGREASIRRADLGDKGVYFRAQVGPFQTSEQANTFCSSLKDAGGQCIVQKN